MTPPRSATLRRHPDHETRIKLHSGQILAAGTSVAVFSHFSDSWIGGFEVATDRDGGYELRRRSDQTVLPKTFPVDDLRVERR